MEDGSVPFYVSYFLLLCVKRDKIAFHMSLIAYSNDVKRDKNQLQLVSNYAKRRRKKGHMEDGFVSLYVVVYAPAHYPPRVAPGPCRGGKGEERKGRAAIQ